MTSSITRLRNRQAQRQQGHAKAAQGQDAPAAIRHAHDGKKLFLAIDPAPANGMASFTEEQYVATIAGMQACLDNFRAAKGST